MDNEFEILSLLKTVAAKVDNIGKGLEDLRKSHDDLRHDVADLKQSHDDLRHDVAALKQSHDDLRKSHDDLRESHNDLRESHDDLRRIVVRIELEHGKKLTALFDGYSAHNDVLKRIEADAAETRFEVGDIHTRLISQEFIIEGIRKAN